MLEKKKIKQYEKNFLSLFCPTDGIGLFGCAILSISASVISFQIRAAKYPEYIANIVNNIITMILLLYG